MILGADPDQLNTVAQRISSRADDYDDAGEQINYWLRRMDWHGPQADAFRSLYHSRMRPQLQSVAAELRQAASELRANAAQQQAASGEKSGSIPGCALPPDGGNWLENLLDDNRILRDILDSFTHPPFPGLPFPGLPGVGLPGVGLPGVGLPGVGLPGVGLPGVGLPGVGLPGVGLPGVGLFGSAFGSTALSLFEIGDFLRLHGGKPASFLVGRLADQLSPFGLDRLVGSGAGKALGFAGAAWSAVEMPFQIQDFVQDLQQWDWNDEASIKQGINSFTDIMIGAGSIGMIIPGGAPIGVGLMGVGYLVKGAVHVIDGDAVGDALWKAWEFGNDTVDFVGDVGESAIDFVGDVGESAIEFAGEVGDALLSGAKKFLPW